MTHVFISYAREDLDVAASLAAHLEGLGWDVWWDRDLIAGDAFGRRIEEQIDSAAAVIVLWSEHSVPSDWVRAEASAGAAREVLVPVALQRVTPPLRFRVLHTIDLVGWRGDHDDGRLADLVRSVMVKAGAPTPLPAPAGDAATPPHEPTPSRLESLQSRLARWASTRTGRWISLAAGLVGLVAIATITAVVVRAVVDDDASVAIEGPTTSSTTSTTPSATGTDPPAADSTTAPVPTEPDPDPAPAVDDGQAVPADDEFPLGLASRGARVGTVQRWLDELGVDLGPSGVDERFGPRTEAAVRSWEAAAGRTTDGVVDRDDWDALRAAVEPDFVMPELTGCVDPDCTDELILVPGDVPVYLVVDGERRLVPDLETLDCLGGWDLVRFVDVATHDRFPIASTTVECPS